MAEREQRVIDLHDADDPAPVSKYRIKASCSNCDWKGEIEIPKGYPVKRGECVDEAAACPECGCFTLIRQAAKPKPNPKAEEMMETIRRVTGHPNPPIDTVEEMRRRVEELERRRQQEQMEEQWRRAVQPHTVGDRPGRYLPTWTAPSTTGTMTGNVLPGEPTQQNVGLSDAYGRSIGISGQMMAVGDPESYGPNRNSLEVQAIGRPYSPGPNRNGDVFPTEGEPADTGNIRLAMFQQAQRSLAEQTFRQHLGLVEPIIQAGQASDPAAGQVASLMELYQQAMAANTRVTDKEPISRMG